MMNKTKKKPVQRLKKIVSQSFEKHFTPVLNENSVPHEGIELELPSGYYDMPEVKFPALKFGSPTSSRRHFYQNYVDTPNGFFNNQIRVYWGIRQIDELRVNFLLMAPYSKYFENLLKWGFKSDNPLTLDLNATFMQNIPQDQADRQERNLRNGFRKAIVYLCSGYLELSSFDDCLTTIMALDFLGVDDEDGIEKTCKEWLDQGDHQSLDRAMKLHQSNARVLKEVGKKWRTIYALVHLDRQYIDLLPEIPNAKRFCVVESMDMHHNLASIPEFGQDEEDAIAARIAAIESAWSEVNHRIESMRYDHRSEVGPIRNKLLGDLKIIPANNEYLPFFANAINLWGTHAMSEMTSSHIEMLLDSNGHLFNPDTKFLLSNWHEVKICLENPSGYLQRFRVSDRTKDRCRIAVEVYPENIAIIPEDHLDLEMGRKYLSGSGLIAWLPEPLMVQHERFKEFEIMNEDYIQDQPISSLSRRQLAYLLREHPDRLEKAEVDNEYLDDICRRAIEKDLSVINDIPKKLKSKEFCLWAVRNGGINRNKPRPIIKLESFPRNFHEEIQVALLYRGCIFSHGGEPFLHEGKEASHLSRKNYLMAAMQNTDVLYSMPKKYLDRSFIMDILIHRKLKLGCDLPDFISKQYETLDYPDEKPRKKKTFIEDMTDLVEF